MRRPIAHLTGAAALLAVLVAVSLTLAPGAFSPGELPPPAASLLPAASSGTQPQAVSPSPHGADGGGTAQPVDLRPVSTAESAALQAAVDRARAAFGLTSVAVGISADAQLGWTGTSGPSRDGTTPLSGTTPFAIASVTKTFTAAVVLQLVDEGRVKLDAAVNDYLPELTIARGVTVRELLSHSSGIADLLAPMRDRLNAEPSRVWQPAEVLALLGPSTFEPGTSWGYSNTNYVIAGMLVERVTGHPFADELEHRITGPLKLRGTGPPERGKLPELMGVSWTSAFFTSAMLDSNAANLVRWGDALYDGSILRAETLAQMLDFNDRGYGLGAEQYRFGGLLGYGHSGLLRGYTTLLVHIPDAHLTLALLATGHLFDVSDLLTYSAPGVPSILSLAGKLRPS
ncbi:MAG: beta-lactamase family protein [Chloroflexi bacterium]|nr:beta-lactamase family protein [Chloroflexota bacterium]